MKQQLGKITLGILVLLLVGITLFIIFSRSQAVPISGAVTDKIGAYTGAGSGQGHNIKASLDLAHTDLDAMITYDTDVLSMLGLGNGNIYYVDASVAGSTGVTWATAVATVDAAVNLIGTATEADTGAIILIAPGHTYTLGAGADGLDIDQAGVKIYGLGVGENRCLFDYDTTTDEVVIGADDVEIHNCDFKANIDSVAHAIDVEAGAENFVINNCRFYVETTGTDEFDNAIMTAAGCDNGKITNCRFEMGAGDAVAAVTIVGSDYLEFSNNIVSGDYSTACFEDKTTASIWPVLDDNILINGTVGGTAGLNTVACITMKADTACIITDNNLFCNVATPDLAIVAADGFLAGNTYNEREGAAGGSLSPFDSAGLKCAYVQPASIAAVTNLFAVTGGPIIIRDIVGVVTTNIVATTCLINYNIDPTEPATDTVFGTDGTALEINGDAAGTVYTWDGVIATDLTATTNGVLLTQGTDVANGLLCPQGMIELAATATNAGVIAFYMVYSPLSPQSTVIPQ